MQCNTWQPVHFIYNVLMSFYRPCQTCVSQFDSTLGYKCSGELIEEYGV